MEEVSNRNAPSTKNFSEERDSCKNLILNYPKNSLPPTMMVVCFHYWKE